MPKTPELIISRPAQVRALASAVRSAIVEALLVQGPLPVRDLAHHLGRSPESLYHHVRILERAGILRVAEVRTAGKTRQAVYALVAPALRLDRTNTSPAMRRARAGAAAAMLARAARRARRAVEAGMDEGDPASKAARVETIIVPLDEPALADLHARIDRLFKRIRRARSALPAPGTPAGKHPSPIALTIAITPAAISPPRAR